jgi:hypothetical protein
MLHSTTNDVIKDIFTNVMVNTQNPLLKNAYWLNVAPAFMSAEIIDLKEFAPVWVYRVKKNLQLTEKNTDMFGQLCGNLVRRFPYRQKG